MENFYQRACTVNDYRLNLFVPFNNKEIASYQINLHSHEGGKKLIKDGYTAQENINDLIGTFFMTYEKQLDDHKCELARYKGLQKTLKWQKPFEKIESVVSFQGRDKQRKIQKREYFEDINKGVENLSSFANHAKELYSSIT